MELVKNLQNQNILKNLVIVILGSLILTLSAKIKIPFYPVPMTMQTFVVLLLGITLGPKIATSTVCLYLVEGILGLPVFSNSPERGVGLIYFTGPTMGYLIGFIFASCLSGYFHYNQNYFLNFVKLFLSVSMIYVFGVLWLGTLIGWDKPLFELGVKPFLIAEIFKLLILTIITNKIFYMRKFI